MKKITYFYLTDCPYCKQADRAIEELKAEHLPYRSIEIERINENEQPDIVAKYDYHAVPCMWIGNDKIYEGRLFESYEECKKMVQKTFEAAL